VKADLAQKGIDADETSGAELLMQNLLTELNEVSNNDETVAAAPAGEMGSGPQRNNVGKDGKKYSDMSYLKLRRLYDIKKEAYSYVKYHMHTTEEDEAQRIDYARRCARLDYLRDHQIEENSQELNEIMKQTFDEEAEKRAEEKHKSDLNSSCVYYFCCCLRPLWWEKGWIRRFFIKGFGCNSKVYMNGILLFLVGEGLSPDDVSDGINALALLNALLITIPFAMLGAITPDFLNTMKEAIEACPGGKTHTGASYYFAAKSLRRNCQCTIISALSALIFAIMYYLFKRNDNSSFRDWWPRGRILIAVTFLLTIITTVSTVALMNCFLYYFAVQGDEICDRYARTGDESAATLLVPTATLVTALYLMT
jgi:hypothetical protein